MQGWWQVLYTICVYPVLPVLQSFTGFNHMSDTHLRWLWSYLCKEYLLSSCTGLREIKRTYPEESREIIHWNGVVLHIVHKISPLNFSGGHTLGMQRIQPNEFREGLIGRYVVLHSCYKIPISKFNKEKWIIFHIL